MTFPTDELERMFQATNQRIRTLEVAEFVNAAGGFLTVTFVNLPAPGQSGRMFFVSDGRKVGEGVGAGTGVPVYDDGGASWRRFSDDTAVAV